MRLKIKNNLNYTNMFLKKSMFIPCNPETEEILTCPDPNDDYYRCSATGEHNEQYKEDLANYNLALGSIIFKGFKPYDAIGAKVPEFNWYIWFWNEGITINSMCGEFALDVETVADLYRFIQDQYLHKLRGIKSLLETLNDPGK